MFVYLNKLFIYLTYNNRITISKMSKCTTKIKPAKDVAKTWAAKKIAEKYKRSMDWAYKVIRKEKRVQDGEYFKNAYADYTKFYNEAKDFFNN